MLLQAGRGFRWNRHGTGEPVGGRDLSEPLRRFRIGRGTVATVKRHGTGEPVGANLSPSAERLRRDAQQGARERGDGAPLPAPVPNRETPPRAVAHRSRRLRRICPHLSAAFPKRTRRGCPCPNLSAGVTYPRTCHRSEPSAGAPVRTVATGRATDGTGTRGRRTLARTRPESGNATAGGCAPFAAIAANLSAPVGAVSDGIATARRTRRR